MFFILFIIYSNKYYVRIHNMFIGPFEIITMHIKIPTLTFEPTDMKVEST